jgi:hypothetical protein
MAVCVEIGDLDGIEMETRTRGIRDRGSETFATGQAWFRTGIAAHS